MEISRRPFFPVVGAFTLNCCFYHIFYYFHLLPAPRSVELSSLTPVSVPGGASGAKRETAGFEPWICLEGCALVARTDQQLLVPTIDVVEVGFLGPRGVREDGFS